MGRNLSAADRLVRIVLGLSLLSVGLFAGRGMLRLIASAVGGLLLFSGTVGFCHVYKALGMCTAPECSLDERRQP